MSKERVCANTPALSRRTVVACMAIAPAATVSAAAAPQDDSEIVALFRQHQAYREWINDPAKSWNDEQLDAHCDRLNLIEDQILALPSKSAADFAAKVVVDSCEGSLFSCWETGEIWKEARQLLEL